MTHTLNNRRARNALVIAAFLISVPAAARAQEPPHATVALVRELPDSTANATIIRTAKRTVLLLREDADVATLATAMTSLYRSQNRTVNGPGEKLVISLHGRRHLASLSPDERQLAERYLAQLRNAKLAKIEGVGTARATTIALEPRKLTLR